MEPSNYAMRNIELKTKKDGKDWQVYVVCQPKREYDAFLTTLCDIYKLEREERETIRKRYGYEALQKKYAKK